MQINLRKLLGLPVITETGTKLGRVADVIIHTDTHGVSAYEVRAHLLGGQVYLISPVQVKEIREDSLIVFDTFIADAKAAAVPAKT